MTILKNILKYNPSDSLGGRTDLVLVGLLLVADGFLAGHHVEVHVVVAADAPAAALTGRDALELQQHVVAALPLLAGRGEAVHPAIHIHSPQQRDGHDSGALSGKRAKVG